MSQLPSIAKLSLACRPCGMPFDRWSDVPDAPEVRQHPKAVIIRATTTCLVCGGDIDEKAELGDETRDLEVLVELPCGHAFHRTCLQGVVRTGQARCPGPDRDFIPQAIIDRLGGTGREGQEAALGPYDPNSGLDYNNNPPITSGNSGNPINSEDEAVYNYPDLPPPPNVMDVVITSGIYIHMNDLIRTWIVERGDQRLTNQEWRDSRRQFALLWAGNIMNSLRAPDTYKTIVEARRLILREASLASPGLAGWSAERFERMKLLIELAEALWRHFHEEAVPAGAQGEWLQLDRPGESLVNIPALGVEWVGFIKRYPVLTFANQALNNGFGWALMQMIDVLTDDDGLYEPMPGWVKAIAQEALDVLTATMAPGSAWPLREISRRLDPTTYVQAFSNLLDIYERVSNPTGRSWVPDGYPPLAPDWVIEWFQVVLKKFHRSILDVKLEYISTETGVVRGGVGTGAVLQYTYTRRT
jgi:hypothetical protein